MRKVYGQSMQKRCPFCSSHAIYKNKQDIPVCSKHKQTEILDRKCACGQRLELRQGKWGPFFLCFSCGPMSFRKGMDMQAIL